MASMLDFSIPVGLTSCVNVRIDVFGLLIILLRMSRITSDIQTVGFRCFGALHNNPVACHFLTNICIVLFAGKPFPGNLTSKFSCVCLTEPILTYASTISILSIIEYIILQKRLEIFTQCNLTIN
ncbi:Hypothetical predicted protein [Octopus vulgaris]|uniref:Uncharacterized protein n=1 Tax=Octopus vulgaris TaxID=6645 RepID=A0AA36FJR5_OCTVU|nr:Hypothetical predicted protein [Octopus vulgaris]